MIAYAKLAAILLSAALLFGGGWQVRTWYDGAQDSARLEAEAEGRKLLATLAKEVATQTEAAIRGITITNRTIYNEVQKEIFRDTVYRDCVLPDAGRLLVNQARSGAAAGKPDLALPAASDSR